MKLFTTLVSLVVLCGLGVHGYFQVEFGTLSPCEAAIERVKKDKQSGGFLDKAMGELIGVSQEIAGKERLAAELKIQKGTMGCYQIALTGAGE